MIQKKNQTLKHNNKKTNYQSNIFVFRILLMIIIFSYTYIFNFTNNLSAQMVNRWEKVNLPFGFNSSDDFYLDVYFLPSNPNYGWVCGYNSKILITTDGGRNWRGNRVQNSMNQLETIQFLNVNVGYVSGPSMGGEGIGSIYKSLDGGSSWFDVSPRNPSSSLWGFHFYDENYGIVLGGDCFLQYFYLTTDGGATWSVSAYNSSGGKLSDPLIIEKDGLCYAMGSGTLWISQNGGRSWQISNRTGNQDWHEEIAKVGNSIAIPVSEGCEGTTSANGGIRFSRNNGGNWNDYRNVNGPMFGTFLLDENTGWAAGFDRGVYYTCDAGRSWNLVNCGLEGHFDDIFFINDTTGWVVGDGIYKSATALTNSKTIIKDTTFFCEGETVKITADSTFRNQRWFNCSNSRANDVNQSGEYISYSFNNPCDTGLIIKHPIKEVPRPNYDILLSGANNNAICEGDTIILSVPNIYNKYEWSTGETTNEIMVTQSGSYIIKVTNEFGCSALDTLNVTFNPLPNPIVDVIGKDRVCYGDSILLNSINTFAYYEWIESNSGNVVSNSKSVFIKTQGNYKLKVRNQAGCERESSPVFVSFINDSNRLEIIDPIDRKLDFGKNPMNNIICKTIKIRNISNDDFQIDSIYLYNKFRFSVPNSQLPLYLNPKAEVNLDVCFYTNKTGKFIDTLKIYDVCNDKLVYLNTEADRLLLEGGTRCELPWLIEVVELERDYFLTASPIYPNPVVDEINFDLFEFIPVNLENANERLTLNNNNPKNDNYNKNSIIEIEIYNMMGEKVFNTIDYPITNEIVNNGSINRYKTKINLSEMNLQAKSSNSQNSENFISGIFIINIKTENKIINQIFQVQK